MTILPGQCRAARHFLGMDQITLAAAAQVSRTTIVSFDNYQAKTGSNNVDAIRRVLEAAGVCSNWTESRA
jgi:hypothetical protein